MATVSLTGNATLLVNSDINKNLVWAEMANCSSRTNTQSWGVGTTASVTTSQAMEGKTSITTTTGSNGGGTGVKDKGINVVPGQTYVASCYLKGDPASYFMSVGGFNVKTQAFVGVINVSKPYVNIDMNGWYRVVCVFTVPTDIYQISANPTTSTGGVTSYMDCFQIERGSSVTDWSMPYCFTVKRSLTGSPSMALTDSANMKVAKRFTGQQASITLTPNVVCRGGKTLMVANSILLTTVKNPYSNLLLANIADCTNTLGDVFPFRKNLGVETLTSDTASFYQGTRSLKCVTPGLSNYEGTFFTVSGLTVGKVYTMQIRYKAPVNSTFMFGINSTDREFPVGNGDYKYTSHQFTATATSTNIVFTTWGVQSVSFNLGNIKVEEGSVATPWTPGNLLTYNQQSVETDLTGISKATGTNVTATLTRDTLVSYNGVASAKLVCNSTDSQSGSYMQIYSTFVPIIGKQYLIRIMEKYVKNNHNNNVNSYITVLYDNSNHYETIRSVNGAWTEHTFVFTPSTTGTVFIELTVVGASMAVGDALYWDEAWLVEDIGANISLSQKMNANIGLNLSDSAYMRKSFKLTGNSDLVSTAIGNYGIKKGLISSVNLVSESQGKFGVLKSLTTNPTIIVGSDSVIHKLEDIIAESNIILGTEANISLEQCLNGSCSPVIQGQGNISIGMTLTGNSELVISQTSTVKVVRPFLGSLDTTITMDTDNTVINLDTPPPADVTLKKDNTNIKLIK